MKHSTIFFLFLTLCIPYLFAATIFEDNFDDGNITGWTGYGYTPANWQANSNMLKYNGYNYVGSIAFGAIDSLTTPTNFTMEADFRITSADSYGHIGFFWGFQNTSNFNTLYLRTHSDHVTHFSLLGGSQSSEYYLNIPGAANGSWYHMKISVDYTTRTMTTNFGSYTTTFTGTTFDAINRNTGGKMGVLTWGEVGYFDNVVITSSSVPEVSTIISMLLASLIFINHKRKK